MEDDVTKARELWETIIFLMKAPTSEDNQIKLLEYQLELAKLTKKSEHKKEISNLIYEYLGSV